MYCGMSVFRHNDDFSTHGTYVIFSTIFFVVLLQHIQYRANLGCIYDGWIVFGYESKGGVACVACVACVARVTP